MRQIAVAVFALAFTATALAGCADIEKALNSLSRVFEEAQAINEPARERDIAASDVFVTASETIQSSPAAAYMEKLSRETLAIINDKSLKREKRETYFRALLARDLDIPLIARFAIGAHWRNASPQQRKSYIKVFMDYLVQTYSRRLGGADVAQFHIIDAKPLGKKDYLVRTTVVGGGGPARADWRLRKSGGGYRIIDLSVEGISMAVTLRQDFTSVIRQKGLDGLVAILKERVS